MYTKNLSTTLPSQGNLQCADNHQMKGNRYSFGTPGCLFDSNGHAFACIQTPRTTGAPPCYIICTICRSSWNSALKGASNRLMYRW